MAGDFTKFKLKAKSQLVSATKQAEQAVNEGFERVRISIYI